MAFEQFIKPCAAKSVRMIGHSAGGKSIAILAKTYPAFFKKRVKKLVLSDPKFGHEVQQLTRVYTKKQLQARVRMYIVSKKKLGEVARMKALMYYDTLSAGTNNHHESVGASRPHFHEFIS